jgi:hypothetical protein
MGNDGYALSADSFSKSELDGMCAGRAGKDEAASDPPNKRAYLLMEKVLSRLSAQNCN